MSTKVSLLPLAAISVLLLCTAGCSKQQALQPANQFFQGKTINYIVASKPGGSYDAYARLIAKHLPRHLPGIRVRVRNLPGAGGIIGANELALSRPDGLTIGTFNTGLVYAQLLKRPGVRFDLRQLSWIGKASEDARVFVTSLRSGIHTVAQFSERKDKVILVGVDGVGSSAYVEALLIAELLDLDFQFVSGMSTGDRQMSMIRGEIDATIASSTRMRHFVVSGLGQPLLSFGQSPWPQTQQVTDLVTNVESPEIFELVERVASISRLTAAPPGVPEDRLSTLRTAYLNALMSPELRLQAKALKLPLEPASGGEVADTIDRMLNLPSTAIALQRLTAS